VMRNPIQISENNRPVQERDTIFWVWFWVFIVLTISIYPLALSLADPLLTMRESAREADIIVVLGGDGPVRAAWTAQLWLTGVAPNLLVSGDGDCGSIRQLMMEQGVPSGVISTECQSRNTWENAQFSAPILQRMNVRTAILVTSWFHSRRAMDRFVSASRNIQWTSVPVGPSEPLWSLAFDRDGIQIIKEYPKTVWYAIRALLAQFQMRETASLVSTDEVLA
jgi:uncharacterized SAM-binding protein YcdF (DUF218 family)